MKDKDEHFWIDDVINRLPSGLIPESKDWSSVLSALTKLKTERNNAIAERNELAAQVERLREESRRAEAVIESHVADPDITDEMANAYYEYMAVRGSHRETPTQSLEAVKREAALERVNAAMDYASKRFSCYDVAENYGDAILEFLKR